MSGLSIGVITVSDTRTPETDTSGRLIAETLTNAGHRVDGPTIVKDEVALIRGAAEERISRVDVLVVSGGTGVTARDVTPEAIQPLITKSIPGFGELFRMLSYAEIGAATIQSRAEAALCQKTLVFILPGSTGAVRLAMEKIILPQIDSRTRPCNFVELLPRVGE